MDSVEMKLVHHKLLVLLTTQAQAEDEGEIGASSFESGGGRTSGHDSDSRFVCINNNNNVVNDGNGYETDPCAIAIETCFAENLGDEDFDTLTTELENGLVVTIEGDLITLNSFADICLALEGLTFLDLLSAVAAILSAAGISLGSDVIQTIAECIEPALAL